LKHERRIKAIPPRMQKRMARESLERKERREEGQLELERIHPVHSFRAPDWT